MAVRIHAGFEARLQSSLALRVGVNDGVLTAGSGITWKSMSLNYGFEDRALGTSHRLGLSWTFGPTTEQSRLSAVAAEEERLRGQLEDAFDRRLSDEARSLLAEAERTFAAGRYEEVLGQLAVMGTLAPERQDVKQLEARSWIQLARQQEEEQDFTEASLYYSRVLALFPGDSSAAAAIQRCGRESSLRAVRSDTLRAWFGESLDAFTTGDLARARAGFSRILRMEPEDKEAVSMLARTEHAIANRVVALENRVERAIDRRLFSQAQQGLDEIRRLDAGHPTLKRLETALSRVKPEPREGAARDSSPESAARTQAAAPGVKITPERQRELEEFYDRGVREYGAGRSANALRFWEMAYAIDPGYKQVKEYLKKEYLMQGMDSFTAGRLNDAIAFWEKAEEIDPQDEKPRGYLERARAQLSRTREIEQHGR
jgi:tetratricopeptide (TPR) repeat protein